MAVVILLSVLACTPEKEPSEAVVEPTSVNVTTPTTDTVSTPPDTGSPPDPTATTDTGTGSVTVDETMAVATISGADPQQSMGYTVSEAGDLNADGFGDVLVGTTNADAVGSQSGAVYAMAGPIVGALDVTAAIATWNGTADEDHAGWVVAAAGDVNGDGFDDVLGQSHRYDTPYDHAGLAFVGLGPPSGTRLTSEAEIVFRGSVAGAGFGLWIAGLGDTSGDGTTDVAIGASLVGDGSVFIFDDALVPGEWSDSDADASFTGEGSGGGAIATLGDSDGDGLSDLLTSSNAAQSSSGAAYVILAPFGGPADAAASASVVVRGSVKGGHLGIRLAGGDFNGDGLGDPVVQSFTPNSVLIYADGLVGELGSADATAHFDMPWPMDGDIASAGDLDGDGADELLVGSPSGGGGGGAWLFFGPLVGTLDAASADVSFVAIAKDEYVGTSVDGAGDVDGDGQLDVLIGSAAAVGGNGAAFLFSGAF